ncbi:MAG: bifunctional UDP-N-acetylmuramoyl-tripeptide:D-alanyl-D-alanine ligase/alanine racemase [Prevotellaceae bacterium]|jgi:alanine racemase|nr:bifunctional UDP-N-acetylmuramoyl-tripeptide:D-alanyl-D-alanine ligase/alanine racemase [Prevotellaceae bacterium]
MSYSIELIAELIGATRIGNHVSGLIDWLLTDSRSLSFPEETLFFALHTKRNDGAAYIPELYERGVRYFVVSNDSKTTKVNFAQFPDATFLLVPDVLKALQKLAAQHRKRFQIPVIGITGSNGKTIVKEWLHQLLSPDKHIVRSPRSYNSQIGVPLSVWQMNDDAEIGIFEAGISQPGEMRALRSMIRPTIGIFTTIGGAHQENFFSMQEKCAEKLELFKDCDILIYNADNELIASSVMRTLSSAREIAWSKSDKDVPLYIRSVDKADDHTQITYQYLGMRRSYRIPFTDDASIENSIHCLAVCLYLMVPTDTIAERMATLEPVAMRMEVKEGKNNCILINDSYNSDLMSLEIALDFQHRRSLDKQLKRTLILSDLLETGLPAPQLYRRISQMIRQREIDKLIGIGTDISAANLRFDGEKYFFPRTETFLSSDVLQSMSNEIILIKGARKFGFERISESLELRIHETVLEVNLSALVSNLKHYQAHLLPDVKTICMVKSSAYGAGSFEIAKTLEEYRVDYLAVAVVDEGVELRKSGIGIPILVMNPEVSSIKPMFEARLEPEVYSFRMLDMLISQAEKEGVANFPIHLKMDTGMHRLGFSPEDVPTLVQRLKTQSALTPRSIFSHLVGSDDPSIDDFTSRQIALFNRIADQLQASFSHHILRHICNSAAIERFPEAQLDMVRLGIGIYGVLPAPDGAQLSNISTLKASILQIRAVAKGEAVGYGRAAVLMRDSRIATLRIGYGDGLSRGLGNGRAYCLVNGCRAPYVGNICMDVCMVDVTDIECKEGDYAVIFGDELPITVLSDVLGTIPYEILTAVSQRVKRVYYQEN